MCFELKGFDAFVEILGRQLQVRWDGKVFTIYGADMAFAQQVVGLLSQVKAPAALAPEPPAVVQAMPPPPSAVKVEPPASAERAVEPPVQPPKKELVLVVNSEITQQAPMPAPMQPIVGGQADAAPIAGDPVYLDSLQRAQKLRDVLIIMINRGIKGLDALLAECTRLKGDIPILKPINDIRGRVERTLVVLEG
jgi:hypothetical protein